MPSRSYREQDPLPNTRVESLDARVPSGNRGDAPLEMLTSAVDARIRMSWFVAAAQQAIEVGMEKTKTRERQAATEKRRKGGLAPTSRRPPLAKQSFFFRLFWG